MPSQEPTAFDDHKTAFLRMFGGAENIQSILIAYRTDLAQVTRAA